MIRFLLGCIAGAIGALFLMDRWLGDQPTTSGGFNAYLVWPEPDSPAT